VKTDPGNKINKSAGGSDDNSILFGELSERTIESLNLIMTGIFKQHVNQLESNAWGLCEEE